MAGISKKGSLILMVGKDTVISYGLLSFFVVLTKDIYLLHQIFIAVADIERLKQVKDWTIWCSIICFFCL